MKEKQELSIYLNFSDIAELIKDGVVLITTYEKINHRLCLIDHPNALKAEAAVKEALGIATGE